LSTSATAADDAVGAHRTAFWVPVAQPSWLAAADRTYRTASARLSRADGGGPTPASVNPPLYYAYAAVAYRAAVGGDELDRLYLVQLFGVLLALATTLGAWLLAGEVLGDQSLPKLTCAAIAGLLPMQTFISTSVTPDALMIPLWTFALWLGVRVVRRGLLRRDAVALGAVAGAAIVTKATSYALVPAVLAALALGWPRTRADLRATRRETVGLAIATMLAPIMLWVGSATILGRAALNSVTPSSTTPKPFSVTGLLSYIWQFYLPRLPFQSVLRPTPGLPLWQVWIREGWGTFGWIDVPLPAALYPVVAALTAGIGLGAATIVSRFRDRVRLAVAGYLALASAALLFGLHLTEYRSLIAGNGPVIQGRYALPVVAVFGLAAGLVVTRLPARARGSVCGVAVAGLMALQLIALATVAKAYYA